MKFKHFGIEERAPVFPVELTEGNPLPEVDLEVKSWIDRLPLFEVATAWGLKVDALNGTARGPHGTY
jgi:hypothetical protein